MSINSSVQQFSAGIASFVAGLIVVEGEGGLILQYEWVGYFAIFASLIAIGIISKGLKTLGFDEASKAVDNFQENIKETSKNIVG